VLRENIKYACFCEFFDYFRAGLKKWIWYEIRVDLDVLCTRTNHKCMFLFIFHFVFCNARRTIRNSIKKPKH
jgi:hypothetical protein